MTRTQIVYKSNQEYSKRRGEEGTFFAEHKFFATCPALRPTTPRVTYYGDFSFTLRAHSRGRALGSVLDRDILPPPRPLQDACRFIKSWRRIRASFLPRGACRALFWCCSEPKKTVKKTCLASFYILNLSFLLPPHRFHSIVGSIKTYRHATKVTIIGPGKGTRGDFRRGGAFCQKLGKKTCMASFSNFGPFFSPTSTPIIFNHRLNKNASTGNRGTLGTTFVEDSLRRAHK